MTTATKKEHVPHGPYERWFKRPFDILCALAAIAMFWWLYVIVAVLVRVKLGSPVIFCQERPGKDEKIFKLYKFRSMTDERDADGNLLPDEVRLTKLGRLLRSTSLDELPEVFNILKGEMSVVGPRPLLVRYLPYYADKERHRHDVRPGLTGLAQVNGRNLLSWEERFAMDLKYAEAISAKGDLVIIVKTVQKVLYRENIAMGQTHVLSDLDAERKNHNEHRDTAVF